MYFPDGLTTLRFLAADGSTGIATSLPNLAGRARSIFAVSPDDKRIAVSVFDWSTRPMKMRIYVEDLAGGGHTVEIFSSASPRIPCSGENKATSFTPGALCKTSIVARPAPSRPV